MDPKEVKILNSVTFSRDNPNYEENSETINLCSLSQCKEISIKKCPKIGSKNICIKHCEDLCNIGRTKECELLHLIQNINEFFKEMEMNIIRFKNIDNSEEYTSKTSLKMIVTFIHRSLLTMDLWQFQINPDSHDCSMICNSFRELFKKICFLDIYSEMIKERTFSIKTSFEYIIKLEILTFIEYSIRNYLEKKEIDIMNLDVVESESMILGRFPKLIDCFNCEDPQIAFLLFLHNIFPISKFSGNFKAETFFNLIEHRQKICLHKIKNEVCTEKCHDFINHKSVIREIKIDLLIYFLQIIQECRIRLLNIGIIHVYNIESGYGASFNYEEPLKIEKEKGYFKLINPILALDKKILRNKLIPYSSYSFTGKSSQEPFLILNQIQTRKNLLTIILRHYYAGIYIPIDINQFYKNQDLIRDIFRGVTYLQEMHPRNVSQGTAANIIPAKIFNEDNIFSEFKKIDFSHFTIRDLGGGEGEMTFKIIEQLISKFKRKKLDLNKVTIIDMDNNLYDKAFNNFLKVINSQHLDRKLVNSLEVLENRDFFKEVFQLSERVKLTIISQVLDMYVLINYNYTQRNYSYGLRTVFEAVINTFLDEGIAIFKKSENDIINRIKNRFKIYLGKSSYLTDFILSPYFASIWLNQMFYNTDYHPLKTNISYVRSNEFYDELYPILGRVFELSENILIIDRGISKNILKDYFDLYEISEADLEIKQPFININVLFIKKK